MTSKMGSELRASECLTLEMIFLPIKLCVTAAERQILFFRREIDSRRQWGYGTCYGGIVSPLRRSVLFVGLLCHEKTNTQKKFILLFLKNNAASLICYSKEGTFLICYRLHLVRSPTDKIRKKRFKIFYFFS